MNKSAVIAMSGGVDSAVVAYLMQKEGYNCKGVNIKMFESSEMFPKDSLIDFSSNPGDAKSVADRLSIPFYEVDFSADFAHRVIENFICSYEMGETPNPCVQCNRYIKFEKLMETMEDMGCDYIATGHYARVCFDKESGRYLLKRAADEKKDQSYFLYSLTQHQLSHTLFPLGELTKERVRQIAEDNGFVNAKKHDSQDICFIPDGDYVSFIKRYTSKEFCNGNFVDFSGNTLGRHKGIVNYTIGQRKGLGISLGKPIYVCGINCKTNEVILGDEEKLYTKKCTVRDINLIAVDKIDSPIRVYAKVRYRHTPQPATVYQTDDDTLEIVFDEPQRAITAGQSAVLYHGDTVIGGGTICRDGAE